MSVFTIKVPASSANLGPGFDTLGLALSLWLELNVSISEGPSASTKLNCAITCEGNGSDKISDDPEKNMITNTALNVLYCHGVEQFPHQTHVHIINKIPLGRGLGSSGAAIVAGVMLADAVADLRLTKDRMMDFCLVEENHPDNISASLYGGFIGSFLETIDSAITAGRELNGRAETSKLNARYPTARARYFQYPWSPAIKVITIIPEYEVKTDSARAVLPTHYDKAEVVFNLQRVAVLTHLLGQPTPNPTMIYKAMQDRMHQQQRTGLVHGLDKLLQLTPASLPGLLGICLSGAGPSILALATNNFEQISEAIIRVIQQSSTDPIHCDWRLLEPAGGGSLSEHHPASLGVGSWLTVVSAFVSRAIRAKA